MSISYPEAMFFVYSFVDPQEDYGEFDGYHFIKRIPKRYTDDDIDDVINALMNKHNADSMWYAIEKDGVYVSSGVTAICRPTTSPSQLIDQLIS